MAHSNSIVTKVFLPTILILLLSTLGAPVVIASAVDQVTVGSDQTGARLHVNGRDFMVLGMNWDYVPIGKNYAYSLWTQSDDFIEAALANEMPLLRSMGVNTIRQYVGVPPRWVEYIYETYGIYTIINHPLGRYGIDMGGIYIPSTDYSDPKIREELKSQMRDLVEQFEGTSGMLMWLLGNENNYGLEWTSAATEDLPEGERESARARQLYSLFGEITDMIHEMDPNRPVAMANGDLQYIDIIAEEMPNLDVFGSNVYRGISARDAFIVVWQKMGIPLLFTEFGADAFNAKTMQEDQAMQARYLIGQWQEIYEQSYGKGRVGNAIGGLTFQFSDGWWKYDQETNLDIHDANASWANGGYQEDFVAGENNMNEEWWGICAKGFPDSYGLYDLYPRAAYYALKKAYRLEPYGPGTTLETIRKHFETITPMESVLDARGNTAALKSELNSKLRVSSMQMKFETYSTGGHKVTTPDQPATVPAGYPSFQGFDHLESFFTGIEAKPAENLRGMLNVNILGNVPGNPINEIYYENRGRALGPLSGAERVRIYKASIAWEDRWFNLDGFYRSGHYHWGYEGDFFGLYREANYGPNIDMYNGIAPVGIEVTGKKDLTGLKIAFGPQLWWGANPALIVKYQRDIGRFGLTGMFQEDLDQQSGAVSSSAIPVPRTRKATLHAITQEGPFTLELGGIWSGENKEGQPYQFVTGESGNYEVFTSYIRARDALGGKFKISYQEGQWSWYLQGAWQGLVADGGADETQTFTGWHLKDSGRGNQKNLLTGVSARFGNWEISPNFLWQKPLEGPIPSDAPQPARPRNLEILEDPFAVRANREMTAAEMILTYDPTPATWMYHWDSDVREDAPFAATVGFIFRHMPTTLDAATFFAADGVTRYAFPGATPPRDTWEMYARLISKSRPEQGIIVNLFAGEGEPNGDDPRLIHRYGGDVRLILGSYKFITEAKFNDWGPYDYHRDFNLTYPLQLMFDVSKVLGLPGWFEDPNTRFGVRATWRSLNEYSPRYCPLCDPEDPSLTNGNEWEIRTYLHMNIGM